MKKIEIKQVQPSSIADQLNLMPKDKIISINGQVPKDIIDYSLVQTDEYIELHVEKTTGQQQIYEIEKEYDEDLGLTFVEPAIDKIKKCHNKCIFCFIDQLPPGMRSTLGVKDDDYRMSFLFGNYVTLTNLKKEELDRIISLHLSPLYISIHATDPDTRINMLGQKKAGKIMEILDVLRENNIDFHGQLVLVPGINDGDILKKSLEHLKNYLPSLLSLSVVPVGLTRHRENCFPLERFNQEKSKEIIALINNYQKIYRDISGFNTVYAADEFFVNAKMPIPPADYYEDYPQYENGVGIISTFIDETHQLKLPQRLETNKHFTLVTAKSAAPYIESLMCKLNQVEKLSTQIMVVENNFFGPSITVAGLLTGTDILATLKGEKGRLGEILIPKAATKDDQLVFLDGMSVEQLEVELETKIYVVDSPLDIEQIIGGI